MGVALLNTALLSALALVICIKTTSVYSANLCLALIVKQEDVRTCESEIDLEALRDYIKYVVDKDFSNGDVGIDVATLYSDDLYYREDVTDDQVIINREEATRLSKSTRRMNDNYNNDAVVDNNNNNDIASDENDSEFILENNRNETRHSRELYFNCPPGYCSRNYRACVMAGCPLWRRRRRRERNRRRNLRSASDNRNLTVSSCDVERILTPGTTASSLMRSATMVVNLRKGYLGIFNGIKIEILPFRPWFKRDEKKACDPYMLNMCLFF